eukprot:TRINITY_DN824_c1_g5_i1.p1 TRINITY_DN824_c1_g5~~TRINITY_DN824_c1_g5_i1.p1  ORF type:complete len:573 (+),score=97.85 TRINITY_DN824_c1_g5_i1:149-1867(+)
MPGKPFTAAARPKGTPVAEPLIKDAWDTDSDEEIVRRPACGHGHKKQEHESDDDSHEEIQLSSGCRLSRQPAKNQKEDPVTLMPLTRDKTITIISPDGGSRLTYNIATLLTVAKTNGRWLMPPHFREDMDDALFGLIQEISPSMANTRLPKKSQNSGEDAHLSDDLIEELHQLELEANTNVNHNQHLNLLSAFNLGYNVSRKNIYFCPHCWDEAIDDARGPQDDLGMAKPRFLRKADDKDGKENGDSDAGSEFNSEISEKRNSLDGSQTRVQSVINVDENGTESAEEEEEAESSETSSSSSSSSSSSDLSMSGHLNMDVFEQKKQKLERRRAREENRKSKNKPVLNEQEEYESMTMSERREVYGPKDTLSSLWKVDDRIETWRNILFSTAQKARAHLKKHHGGTSPVVETLRDKITRYIEHRNQRFMNSPWFDESKLTHQQILAPSNHAYWFWFARYNVMRYNTILQAVESSDGTGSKFVTEQNAHNESDSSCQICENSTSSSEVQRRRQKMKQLRKKRHARKNAEISVTESSESSDEPSVKLKKKGPPSSSSSNAHQKRSKPDSDEDLPAF